MAMTDRDKRALKFLAMAAVPAAILLFWPTGESAAPATAGGTNAANVVPAVNDDPLALERQLTRLRKKQAELPVKENIAKDLLAQLTNREKGLIRADTLPQAQAQLAQLVRQTGRAQGIDFRSLVMGTPRSYGGEYGEIILTAATDCKIEQIVNFVAELTKLPELVATEDVRISSTGAKEKTLSLQLTISGLVPKKLVPEKKGTI
jgi:Tfp pilus assembly protein PilO